MKLSKNFNSVEFDCKDGTAVPESLIPNLKNLVIQLQILRDALGEPLRVLSGYRTPKHNKAVGGASGSMHLQAQAADLTVKSKTPKQLKAFILDLIKQGKMQDGGIGLYAGFIHYDIGRARRW
jgi:uncharacterized protein YcbK (DUF882 family)